MSESYHTPPKPPAPLFDGVESGARLPRVLNIKDLGGVIPAGAVYVGRDKRYGDTRFGNPFKIGGVMDGRKLDRGNAIFAYSMWLDQTKRFALDVVRSLRGKDLVCHCAPLECHGDVLLAFANHQPGFEWHEAQTEVDDVEKKTSEGDCDD